MSMETKEPVATAPVEEGLAVVLPRHLTEIFERADRQIQDAYGMTPGVARLVRLWLASGTPAQVRREFELAVLDVNRRGIEPHPNGEFDEDCL